MKALRVATYEWEKLEFTPLLWKNLWAKGGPNRASIDLWEKWMLDYQLTILLVEVSYVRLSLKVRSLYETYTWGYTWRPLACYPFINIKLASYHLLLYVVYLCQNHEILLMRSFVTSKNVKWHHLIWPILYIPMHEYWVP